MPTTPRILIVDDVESNLVALEALLESPAVALDRAHSGNEALHAVSAREYSLILLDVQMPEMDGFSTATLIRRRVETREVPIIFVTAHGAQPDQIRRAYATGAADFLTKPLNPDVLRAKVAVFVDLSLRTERIRTHSAAEQERRLRAERQRWETEALRKQVAEQTAVAGRERTARIEAEQANHIKDEFLSTLSHELRTPLNVIMGWTSLLRRRAVDAEQERGLEVIERNARAQAKLVEDMLDISRAIAGELRISAQPLALADLLARAVAAARPAAESKGLSINLQADTPLPPVVADPQRLQQVLAIVLSNAVKFTSAGGIFVDLDGDGDGSMARIRVRDTGAGIEPEFLPRVFERFRQGKGGTRRSYGGLGITLSLARSLIELHGGQVTADSAGAGAGATFTITLPIGAATLPVLAAGTAAPGPAPDDAPPLAGASILVVDDEPDAREVLLRILAREGAVVRAAASVDEGLTALAEFHPDVLVSDIGMPEQDGYDLIRRVRVLPADDGGQVPAVALTAYASVDDAQRIRSAGFQAHIAKPVDPDRLILSLRSLVRARNRLH
jgi:signal transduction histidine kinase